MKSIDGMFEEELWHAVVSCNALYDGKFYYAIRTTGIFCRPSCKSKQPKYKNVTFYATELKAMEAGYRPCKRCRPDLLRYMPEEAVVKDTKEIMEQEFFQLLDLSELAQKVGVSKFHLHRLFKKNTGSTPRKYLEKVRVRHAEKLIINTKKSIAAIAFQTGFQSISGFYKAFRRETGKAPSRYRTENAPDIAMQRGDST
ncbi:bifunctional transcriptional activator/DNA repair enzyme AdaA [Virgibacillus ihumii]|uniref:bifunctional transcriptional activator/DNA repair enzyme AdaA n=1 Tax=Virgibacillus ihumii TaxID=2686091 RepID=UPI00157BDF84|nr:bifunctional transcriptional activator/DNA repair enzyme AdaA [Virgibacillus ihumii]